MALLIKGGEIVTVTDGGLATSSVGRRRWLRGGEEQHHLIDPSSDRIGVRLSAGTPLVKSMALYLFPAQLGDYSSTHILSEVSSFQERSS